MRFRFVMGRVFSGLGRNMAMTISVIIVTFISLLFVGIGGLAQFQVSKMQKEWYSRFEVSVYMCAQDDTLGNCNGKQATEEQIADVKAQLEQGKLKEYVKTFEYQDQETVFRDFQKQFGDTTYGQAAEPEMLPSAFRIKLKDPTQYKIISAELTGEPGVEQVQDQSTLVQPLMSVFSKASAISLGLAAVMGFAAVLLITTTIKLSAISRQKETQIMRMEGATSLFIQLPFMIEGALSTLIGALLASGTLWATQKYVISGWIAPSISFIQFVGPSEVAILSVILVAAALVLAVIASVVSLAKYAKV